jgi:ribosomal protein L40E
MAASKFKVCPICGERNPPALLECEKCETDLTGVKMVDEALLAALYTPVNVAAPADDNRDLVKICDCGAKNPPQARKCFLCGEDIFDVRATESQPDQQIKAVLSSVDRSFSFILKKPITVVGREAEMREYLKLKTYVSRKHAKFVLANGEIFVENLSGANRTFINNKLIPDNTPILLKNGDEIGLGGKLINGERQTRAAYLVIEVSHEHSENSFPR